ncbi:MAG TPA: helix-turn-helix domain-containing protein [Streptomyces sp.]|nr:helix-turn-helix domain-containing protein [Streptomyces sp.]
MHNQPSSGAPVAPVSAPAPASAASSVPAAVPAPASVPVAPVSPAGAPSGAGAGEAGAPVSGTLHRLAHDCLENRLEELVDRYVAEVSGFDGYRSTVDTGDLRDTARDCFELLLRLIGGLPLSEELRTVSERLGRRRAQQGVPLERLLQAIRVDFRVLWTVFLEQVPPAGQSGLTCGAVRVWEAVEFHTVRAHAGYLDEVAVLARERERERIALMSRLLSSDGGDQQLVAQVATLLRVGAQDDFAVAVAPPPFQAGLRRAVTARLGGQTAHHLHQHQGMLVLVARLPHGVRALSPSWLEGVPCAVGPVAHGLARVPGVVRATEAVASVLDTGATGPVALADAWPAVAAVRLGPMAGMLADAVLGGLDPLPPHERERLVETVIAYCASGTVAGTAGALYCHRNTVLNRLRRFTELTGFDPTRPERAATVLFALHCRG